jgi:hypothetical protein
VAASVEIMSLFEDSVRDDEAEMPLAHRATLSSRVAGGEAEEIELDWIGIKEADEAKELSGSSDEFSCWAIEALLVGGLRRIGVMKMADAVASCQKKCTSQRASRRSKIYLNNNHS